MSLKCHSCSESIQKENFYLHFSQCIPVFQKCPKCNEELLKSELEDHLFAHNLQEEDEKNNHPKSLFGGCESLFGNNILKNNPSQNLFVNSNIDGSKGSKTNLFTSRLEKPIFNPFVSHVENENQNSLFYSPRVINTANNQEIKINKEPQSLFSINNASQNRINNINRKQMSNNNLLDNMNEKKIFSFGEIAKNSKREDSEEILSNPKNDLLKKREMLSNLFITNAITDKNFNQIVNEDKKNQLISLFGNNYNTKLRANIIENPTNSIKFPEKKTSFTKMKKNSMSKTFYSKEDHIYTKTDPKLIKLLSESVIQNTKDLEETECCICLCDFNQKEKIITIPCGHYFHSKCIRDWLEKDNTCPTCKFIIDKNSMK